MPAETGIHDFPSSCTAQAWMPTFVGMTMWALPMGQ
jgi:hypothetical protein